MSPIWPQLLLDLFAGPGGWSEGLRSIGLADVGLEWDRDACRTRAAAGHKTIRCDVARYPVEPFVGKVRGLIASPPCQAFSMAGKRQGMLDLGRIHAAVEAARSGWRDELRDGPWADPRSALILEPLRWAWALRPEWIACEQVPPALPVWEHMADVLGTWGYRARAVVLHAEQYGVPQTRARAFLLAHRTALRLPTATHQKYQSGVPAGEAQECRPGLFGPGVLPWVSMAEACGWEPGSRALDRRVGGFAADARAISDDRPAPTLSLSHGREVFVRTGKNQDHGDGTRSPYERSVERPSPVVDTASRSWLLRIGNQERATERTATERTATEPAPTTLYGNRVNDVRWVRERPATAVCGDPRLSPPGYRGGKADYAADPNYAVRAFDDAIRIELREAAVLQSFRADYPFQGNKTACFRQVGDAVPPLLARAVIGALAA